MRTKIGMAAAALCIIFILTTCQSMSGIIQEPTVSLHSVELTKVDFNGMEFLCKVQIDNPNPVNIPFPEVGWEIFLNNNRFTSGVLKNNQRIRAMDTTLVEVQIKFSHLDVFRAFQSLRGSRQAAYMISLDTKFALPIIRDKVWHFEHRGNIPLLQMPTLNAPSMKVDSMDFTKAEILVTANINNPNAFDFPPAKIEYEYLLNRNPFLTGSTQTDRPIAASSVTPISFRLSVNYADLNRTLQTLQNATNVPSLLYLTVDFGIPIFGEDAFRFEVPGSLPMLRF